MKPLPIVGAALRLSGLDALKPWIRELDRDVEIQDPSHDFPVGQWREKADFWKRAMGGYKGRLGVHGPYDGVAIASRDPDAQKFAQAKLLDCLGFCEAVGATHCVVHSPFHFLGSSAACHSPTFGLDAIIDCAEATLAPVLRRAEAIGCCLVVENIFDRHTAPLRALLDAFDSPFLKRSVDTGHARIAETTASGPSPEFWIREAGGDLEHIHLQDTNGENDYHWTPGLGDIGWPGVFHAIGAIDATPRLIIEVKDVLGAWTFLSDSKLAR